MASAYSVIVGPASALSGMRTRKVTVESVAPLAITELRVVSSSPAASKITWLVPISSVTWIWISSGRPGPTWLSVVGGRIATVGGVRSSTAKVAAPSTGRPPAITGAPAPSTIAAVTVPVPSQSRPVSAASKAPRSSVLPSAPMIAWSAPLRSV